MGLDITANRRVPARQDEVGVPRVNPCGVTEGWSSDGALKLDVGSYQWLISLFTSRDGEGTSTALVTVATSTSSEFLCFVFAFPVKKKKRPFETDLRPQK